MLRQRRRAVATNIGKDAETIKLDKTAPTITVAATPSPNANGWSTQDQPTG